MVLQFADLRSFENHCLHGGAPVEVTKAWWILNRLIYKLLLAEVRARLKAPPLRRENLSIIRRKYYILRGDLEEACERAGISPPDFSVECFAEWLIPEE